MLNAISHDLYKLLIKLKLKFELNDSWKYQFDVKKETLFNKIRLIKFPSTTGNHLFAFVSFIFAIWIPLSFDR